MHMNPPSRREFVTYAAAATLASALPMSAQSTDKPLAVDVIGPMAVQWSGSRFCLWMPELVTVTQKGNTHRTHEAGIITPVVSFELPKNNYDINGIDGLVGGTPSLYTGNRTLYQDPNAKPPQQSYVQMSLPMPFHIVLIQPVLCRIWSEKTPRPKDPTRYATGLRLLYPKAGSPTLVPKVQDISFDPAPDEVQKDMSISYVPYNTVDPGNNQPLSSNNPKEIFTTLATGLGLKLNIDCGKAELTLFSSAHRPCRSPIIRLP
jgi:hypothetical protein